jgi:hypothetical protein
MKGSEQNFEVIIWIERRLLREGRYVGIVYVEEFTDARGYTGFSRPGKRSACGSSFKRDGYMKKTIAFPAKNILLWHSSIYNF